MRERGEGRVFGTSRVLIINEETWKYLETFDVIGLTETWIDEEGWKKLRNNLSRQFEWDCILATRETNRGRAKGEILMEKSGLDHAKTDYYDYYDY